MTIATTLRPNFCHNADHNDSPFTTRYRGYNVDYYSDGNNENENRLRCGGLGGGGQLHLGPDVRTPLATSVRAFLLLFGGGKLLAGQSEDAVLHRGGGRLALRGCGSSGGGSGTVIRGVWLRRHNGGFFDGCWHGSLLGGSLFLEAILLPLVKLGPVHSAEIRLVVEPGVVQQLQMDARMHAAWGHEGIQGPMLDHDAELLGDVAIEIYV